MALATLFCPKETPGMCKILSKTRTLAVIIMYADDECLIIACKHVHAVFNQMLFAACG